MREMMSEEVMMKHDYEGHDSFSVRLIQKQQSQDWVPSPASACSRTTPPVQTNSHH